MSEEAVVSVSSLTKRYRGMAAVEDLTFSLGPGSVTGFLGPNGAGKSTTLRLLLGLAEPTQGDARVFGRRYRELGEPARRVGAMLESSDFHPGRSGRDHLRVLQVAADLPTGRVAEMLELVELDRAAGQPVGSYSLGMRQRLGLAGALLGDRPRPSRGDRAAGRARRSRPDARGHLRPADRAGAGMIAQLRAEILKQRSTRTNLGLLVAMLVLVLFVVLLHGAGLPAGNIAGRSDQVKVVFGWAELLGALFAALVGVLSITAEFRYGTIRPTLLATPGRRTVVAAKVSASMLSGALFGVLAAAVAIGVGAAALAARGVELRLGWSDYAWLLGGSAAAAALWAAIGVGVGAIVRNQVPAVAGICAWLLFVETVLLGDIDIVGDIGRFTPGALGRAATGQDASLAPVLAVLLLAIYAVAAAAAGSIAALRRDVA